MGQVSVNFRGSALPWVAPWVRGGASAKRLRALEDPRVRELLRVRFLRAAPVTVAAVPRPVRRPRPAPAETTKPRPRGRPKSVRVKPDAAPRRPAPDLEACFRSGHRVVGIAKRRCVTCAAGIFKGQEVESRDDVPGGSRDER